MEKQSLSRRTSEIGQQPGALIPEWRRLLAAGRLGLFRTGYVSVNYSTRNAVRGSTADALRAGTKPAISAIATSKLQTATYVAGSAAVTP